MDCPLRARNVPAGGNPFYYVEDMLGSSRIVAQNNSVVCYDADFYPYGGERPVTNTCPQNYKFEGKERDTETGNDDFGARYYSNRFGRWLSADWSNVPVPYANLTNPQTLNLYAMVSDDPESFADLDGHYTVSGLGEFGGQGCMPSMKLCEEEAQNNEQNQQQPAQPHVDPQTAANTGIAKDLVNNAIGVVNMATAFLFGDAAAGLGYDVPQIPELQPSNTTEKTAMTLTEVAVVGVTLLTGQGEAKAAAESVSVYQKVETAYVGITKNLVQRELQHGEQLEKIVGGLTRNQARGVEQAIIEQKGLAKNGGALTNKINSISRANPMYKAAVEFGRQILKSVGF